MTSQPQDVSHCTFNEDDFKNLDIELFLRSDSQSTNTEHDADLSKYLACSSDEFVFTHVDVEATTEISDSYATSSLAPFYDPDEQLFPDYQLDEFQSDYLPEVPINEVTSTITICETQDNNVSSEMNLNESNNFTVDQIETMIKQMFDKKHLENVDNSIEQRTMSVEIQPPANLRPRYKSDGKRQIEKSRTKPMKIQLPKLIENESNLDHSFWLRLGLITYSENLSDQVYHHINKLEYHSDDVEQLNDGTACIPLNSEDIKEGKKILPRLSIIKTKQNAYQSSLVPFNLSDINNDLNKNNNEITSAKKAKDIFNQYNMKASRITCQLLIKQNQTWHFTNISCTTDVIEEKKQKNATKKRSNNSLESDEDESIYEYPNKSKSKPIKRMRQLK